MGAVKIAACIPTRFEPPTLAPLRAQLEREGVLVLVRRDRSQPPALDIYRWWNQLAQAAVDLGATHIAMLNDDVELPPGALAYMALVLDKHPEVGVVYPDMERWRHFDPPPALPKHIVLGDREPDGMTGFCFMFRADLPVRFDTRYRWWYGDTQFQEDVRDAGLEVRQINGLGIQHLHGYSHKFVDEHWLRGLIRDDKRRWTERHARSTLKP